MGTHRLLAGQGYSEPGRGHRTDNAPAFLKRLDEVQELEERKAATGLPYLPVEVV